MTAPDWLIARPIAHRGLHDRAKGIIENSLAAAEAAIAGGFAIECDVQDAADGEAMVFHDFTLDRLTDERGEVRDRRSSELAGIALASSRDTIPTLGRFLDGVGGRVPVIVEIKSRFDGDLRLTRRVGEILAAYRGAAAVKSFDPAVVGALRAAAPGRPRGIVAESHYRHPDWDSLTPAKKHELANLLHFAETEPDFLSWRVGDLPCAAPFLCRQLARMPVMAWTVRTAEDVRRAASHADQLVFEGFRPD